MGPLYFTKYSVNATRVPTQAHTTFAMCIHTDYKQEAQLLLKGTLRRRLTYIFFSFKYNIFTYKVWTLNFYRKGSEI